MAKRLIAVIGATGAQGGGLVRAVLADPGGGFAVRAVTRKPGEGRAAELARAGAEVAAADLDDPASLVKAFEGADCAYCVTNFWEHFSPEKELAQAKNLARAARAAGVGHVIWSTLEDTRLSVPLTDDRMPTLMGTYKVPHFDAKGSADAFFAEEGVPTTFLLTSFYWDNLIHFGMGPKKGEDGKWSFVLPMADRKLPGIAAEDIGRCAYGIFKRGAGLVGRTVGIAGEHLTGAAMASALSSALDRQIAYAYVPPEVYRTFGFPGAEDLGNMFQYNRDFADAFCARRDLAFSRSVNPELQTFAQWLARHVKEIPG
ncbi:NmrA/HSCARG family protein [Geothrix sp. 21YS21S-2]|uniref:NmrA/HSCARG family protein n=1 Tax=Geothrix sp. 21YS21S-2 TaxID=3068893 RepID=UPI0027BB0AE0|nr:NmrA/HSCARG family protein [Geothrix sp. 21YS21S-2]